MIFEWNDNKAFVNLKKHGVAFEVAEKVWDDQSHLILFDRFERDEERWHAIGLVRGVMILTVVHAYPESNDDSLIRIISARRATPAERKRHETNNV